MPWWVRLAQRGRLEWVREFGLSSRWDGCLYQQSDEVIDQKNDLGDIDVC